jgi:hypothetical protein
MITVLNEQRVTVSLQARVEDDALWLDGKSIEQATAWTWKPEGLCQEERCVPLPQGDPPLVRDGLLNIADVWRHMGHPVVHDDAASTWVLGAGSTGRQEALSSLVAPDFELPDLDGRMHRLSDYRGKKVFLGTWASW